LHKYKIVFCVCFILVVLVSVVNTSASRFRTVLAEALSPRTYWDASIRHGHGRGTLQSMKTTRWWWWWSHFR